MMLKFGRIAVVSTAVLALAATSIPSRAEADGYYRGGYGHVGYGYRSGGYYGAVAAAAKSMSRLLRRPAAASMLRRPAVSTVAAGTVAAGMAAAGAAAAGTVAAFMAPVTAVATVTSLQIESRSPAARPRRHESLGTQSRRAPPLQINARPRLHRNAEGGIAAPRFDGDWDLRCGKVVRLLRARRVCRRP